MRTAVRFRETRALLGMTPVRAPREVHDMGENERARGEGADSEMEWEVNAEADIDADDECEGGSDDV